MVIYAIALGATQRGSLYLERYPGTFGWILFAACTGVVFIAGAPLLDVVRPTSGRSESQKAAGGLPGPSKS